MPKDNLFKKINVKLLEFYTKDDLKLHGILVNSRPKNRKVIIHVFGMTGDFFSFNLYWKFIKTINNSEFDLFLPNNRGMGLISFFELRKKWIPIGTAKENFKECVFDIKSAVDTMENLGYSDIILQGHSTGCQKITYYQSKLKDKRVNGIILLAPVDDYNFTKKKLGSRFEEAVKTAKVMIKRKAGNKITPEWISHYTAKRFLSYADPNNLESKIFNYDSKLLHFRKVGCPLFVMFGSNDKFIVKHVKKYIDILKNSTVSKEFGWRIIDNTDHNFTAKHQEVADSVIEWLRQTFK